jgi:hypothetical protein
MTDGWGRPVETTGEFITPAKLQGHLIIVYPLGYVPHIQTKFTRADKPSDAITVDVVDLDDKDEATGLPGKVYRQCNWMQAHMIASLRPMIGSRILGVVSLGVSKSGMNAPWIIVDMLDNPGAKQRAVEWGQANPDFAPSAFSPRAEPQAAPPPQPVQHQAPAPSYPQPAPAPSYPPQQPQGYQPNYAQPQYTQPQYTQPAPQPQSQAYPVQGSPQVSNEEMTMLQRMRAEQQRKVQEQQAQFGDNPPF